MIDKIIGLVSSVFKPAADLVDNLTTTDEEKKSLRNKFEQIQNELSVNIMTFVENIVKEKSNIIQAEIKSDSFLAKNWRPAIMVMFGLIVFNNYLLYPYLKLFWSSAPVLTLPPELWGLLKIGFGGYLMGRSVEKVVDKFKNGGLK